MTRAQIDDEKLQGVAPGKWVLGGLPLLVHDEVTLRDYGGQNGEESWSRSRCSQERLYVTRSLSR